MEDTLYNLKWRNYENHMLSVMDKILSSESFADVTLVCGDPETDSATAIKAHKILLGASSPYFEVVFGCHPSPHPVIILPSSIRPSHLQHVLHFIYRGEVQVPQEDLGGVLNCANQLRIRGLEADTSPPKEFMFTSKMEYSRESSVEHDRPVSQLDRPGSQMDRPGSQMDRPGSQMSGAGKRKSSPKFHFLKNHRRKTPLPTRVTTPDVGSAIEGQIVHVEPSGNHGIVQKEPSGNLEPTGSSVPEPGSHLAGQTFINAQVKENNAWEPPLIRVIPGEGIRHLPGIPGPRPLGSIMPVPGQFLGGMSQGHFLNSRLGEKPDSSNLAGARISPQQDDEDDHIEVEGPVDFTIKSEMSGSPGPGDRPTPTPDFTDMAAFFAAVRSSVGNGQTHQQDIESVGSYPTKHIPAQYNSKNYTKRDMVEALDSLKTKKLSLSRASEMYGIPPTTLWQRANRMGIPTPKKETANKTWSEQDLNSALDALRQKKISANKAAKVYKIPSSTLYKIARKEGIELAQPFNAVATTWTQDDLNSALEAIKGGMAVQKAAAEYGIPSGTLYGRCKKVGIELSKAAQVHWSEEDMVSALETVRTGTMSINQAAINFSLPYSSLYGRINRLKRDESSEWGTINADEEPYEDISNSGLDFSEFLAMRSGVEVTEVPSQQNLQTTTESQQQTDTTDIIVHK